jgi:hypothetical protein
MIAALSANNTYPEAMRAAYDWAIDCFSDWIRENGYEYVSYHYELGVETDWERMIADFNQAMRPTPQQQENNFS